MKRPARSFHRPQHGFTLIEVIVAFALLALALTLLLGTLSGAARQIRTADDASRASLHAQSLFSQLGVAEVLQPGHREGEFEEGRYRWSLDITPYTDPQVPGAVIDPSTPRLLELQLVVRWGDAAGQVQRWQTLRLAPPDPNQSALP